LGVLSAAAEGVVDDQRLLNRGVRPGVPKLYKSAFPKRQPPHLFLGASSGFNEYEVSLHNPLNDPAPAWRYKTEKWVSQTSGKLVGRSPASSSKPNPDRGLAALKLVEVDKSDPGARLLRELQEYLIYSPTTSVLRGIAAETQPKSPLGLSGGGLPEAVVKLLHHRSQEHPARVARQALGLIDWAKTFGACSATDLPLSPAAAASPKVIRFTDKFMAEGRNVLSGYDASEGALYVLFLAVLAAHPASPKLFAVDNADHGLNPRLARSLFRAFCSWVLDSPLQPQALLTTHNPAVLDGLPLQDDRVRLFTVSRTSTGRTSVQRIVLDEKLLKMANDGWTLSRLRLMGHLGGVPHV
jgi:hypothetical protein